MFNTANAQENTATIDVLVKGESLPFTLTVEKDPANIISVVDNKVTAKVGSIGSAVVVATYQIGDDELKMRFNVDVLPAFSNEVMYWSTSLQQAHFSEDLLQAGETLQSITDFDTSAQLYSVKGGYNNKLLDVEGNEIKTFRAIVRGSKGTLLTLNLRSYTLVISSASDLDFIAPDTEITGSYALANNITVDEWTHVSLGDITTAKCTTFFNGVFDGNGYTLTFPQRAFGLFGRIKQNAVIKNVRLNVIAREQIGEGEENETTLFITLNKGVLLGVDCAGVLENMYIQVSGTVCKQGIGLVASFGSGSSMKNVVVDYGSAYNFKLNGAGMKGYLTGGTQLPDETTLLANIYLIGENKTKYLHERGSTYKYTPHVVAENEYGGEESNETVLKGVRRYDNVDAVKADQNKDLVSFDSIYWDTTSGAPVWKDK